MKATMSMEIDTPWGNMLRMTVESELDNAHVLNTGELCRLEVQTLSVMHAEVRRHNERFLNLDTHDREAHDRGTLPPELEVVRRGFRERERLDETDRPPQ